MLKFGKKIGIATKMDFNFNNLLKNETLQDSNLHNLNIFE